MKDLALWLGLISAPAIVSLLFAPRGFEAFDEPGRGVVPARVIEEARVDYAMFCARCHGRMAEGTRRAPGLGAPPPGAASAAFRQAVWAGALASGDGESMPPFRALSAERIDGIIAYLRRMGQATGQP